MAAYRDNAEKVCSAIVFSKRNQDTFGRDVEQMITAKLTFNEAIGTGKFPIMAKQGLKTIQRRFVRAIGSGGILKWGRHRPPST